MGGRETQYSADEQASIFFGLNADDENSSSSESNSENFRNKKKYSRCNYNGRRRFHRACLDTGAQKSVIGEKQAKSYCGQAGITNKPKKSNA